MGKKGLVIVLAAIAGLAAAAAWGQEVRHTTGAIHGLYAPAQGGDIFSFACEGDFFWMRGRDGEDWSVTGAFSADGYSILGTGATLALRGFCADLVGSADEEAELRPTSWAIDPGSAAAHAGGSLTVRLALPQ
jgi:hypothetical protein